MVKKLRSKKAVSEMIGYVLLIAMAIIVGGVSYVWLSSYVPSDAVACPDGVSFLIKSMTCENGNIEVNLTNNGLFDVAGYVIRGTADENTVATKDFSGGLVLLNLDTSQRNGKIFLDGSSEINLQNLFLIGNESSEKFNSISGIKVVEITPVMFTLYEKTNKIRLGICGNAKKRQRVSCGV
jgi:FlaG/FlaF family flagellin (archaellin)